MTRSTPDHAGMTPCCTLRLTATDEKRLVRLFKALGNPIRFEILKYLVTHPECITGDIVDVLPIAQATVSQHLKVLGEAGWITAIPDGPATCYELNEQTVTWFREVIGEIF